MQSDGGSLYDGFENLWEKDEVTQGRTEDNNNDQVPYKSSKESNDQNRQKQQPNFYSQLNSGSDAGKSDFGSKTKIKSGGERGSMIRSQNGGNGEQNEKENGSSVSAAWGRANNLITRQRQQKSKSKAGDQTQVPNGRKQNDLDQPRLVTIN